MTRETRTPRPDVIVDFTVEDGMIFVSVENIGDHPALQVSARFEPRITGLGGEMDLGTLSLFRRLAFLAPRKAVRTFLDTSASYFRREQPTCVRIDIAYQDRNRKRFRATIRHDLAIYRDIGEIRRLDPRNPVTSER